MPTDEWDKKEIQKLALVSGKPLEVQCAEIFLKAHWNVSLGTYYVDFASEKIRELDFLAEKDFAFSAKDANQDTVHWFIKIRVLGSCKGFPQDLRPATFSVESTSLIVNQASLMCYECGFYGKQIADKMKRRSAEVFLHQAHLSNKQQIVGFDVLQRKEDAKRPLSFFEYSRKTDRDLYEGSDSAIKAATFWYREDKRQKRIQTAGSFRGYIALNIPLLVSSYAFWNVSIDKGTVGEPELKNCGFHVGLYPSVDSEKSPEPLMSVLWAVDELEELTRCLGRLINPFMNEIEASVSCD